MSNLLTHIDQFLDQFSQRYRPKSVEVKSLTLRQLSEYLSEHNIQTWQLCDQACLQKYIIYRHKNGLSLTSLKTHLASIRVFFDFLESKEIITSNPARLVKTPKVQQALPKVIAVDTIQELLDQMPDPDNPLEIRDLAICELFYSSGVRLSELTALDTKHISLSANEIRIIDGKGGKDRIVPLGNKAKEALQRWLTIRDQWMKLDNALFITQRGNRLTSRQVSNRVKHIASKLGKGLKVNPHMFRHSMATHVLESSQDIRSVQELLGHADISTTQVYTHLDFGHLSKVFDSAHPRAKKKSKK
ncbi:tyrosine recombinase XerC [Wohlfahrtiimonas larvae]|uniref:Tyrosine recombinase XerC n=1 Tax=Wohlfahrtiimonas larvae TaxID=1157986 RepID=A0ABP9MA74_9GAMM|nr:tyrosine recombinase XerC [Wohlfahrtiimonas larvae]